MPPSDTSLPSIRPASAADLPALGRLGAMLVGMHHALDQARFLPATPDTEQGYASFLETQLGRPNVVLLVADRAGDVLGYAYSRVEGTDYMSLRGPAGVLHDLLVDPAHRGQGVGRRLLDATLEALAARGTPRVVLSTAKRNAAAHSLFTSAGFRPTMIEMTRELGGS